MPSKFVALCTKLELPPIVLAKIREAWAWAAVIKGAPKFATPDTATVAFAGFCNQSVARVLL